jgi:hypothetical protein
LFHKYMEMGYKDLDEYKTKFMRKIIESWMNFYQMKAT